MAGWSLFFLHVVGWPCTAGGVFVPPDVELFRLFQALPASSCSGVFVYLLVARMSQISVSDLCAVPLSCLFLAAAAGEIADISLSDADPSYLGMYPTMLLVGDHDFSAAGPAHADLPTANLAVRLLAALSAPPAAPT